MCIKLAAGCVLKHEVGFLRQQHSVINEALGQRCSLSHKNLGAASGIDRSRDNYAFSCRLVNGTMQGVYLLF
jgi:hypothetical protein